jgi:hypothetical protein
MTLSVVLFAGESQRHRVNRQVGQREFLLECAVVSRVQPDYNAELLMRRRSYEVVTVASGSILSGDGESTSDDTGGDREVTS